MKKLISTILLLCMVITMSTTTAFAEGNSTKAPELPETEGGITVRFYLPDEWKNEDNQCYDGKSLDSCCAGIFTENASGKINNYIISNRDNDNSNIFVATIPDDVKKIWFWNLVNEESRQVKMTGIYNVYDDYYFTEKNLDGKILVADPVPSMIGFDEYTINSRWFYYYGDGKYGEYRSLFAAELNNDVLSDGEYKDGPNYKEEMQCAVTYNLHNVTSSYTSEYVNGYFSTTLTPEEGCIITSVNATIGTENIAPVANKNGSYTVKCSCKDDYEIHIYASAVSVNEPEIFETPQELLDRYPKFSNLKYKELGSLGEYKLYYQVPYYVHFFNYKVYIDKYCFDSISQPDPYDLSLFVVGNGKTYNLEEAYFNGLINIDDAVKLLNDSKIDFCFNVSETDKDVQTLRKFFNADKPVDHDPGFMERGTFSTDKIGIINGYSLINCIGINLTNSNTINLGDYKVNMYEHHQLYLVKNDEVLTIDEALEKGIIAEKDYYNTAVCILENGNLNVSYNDIKLTKTPNAIKKAFPKELFSLTQIGDDNGFSLYYNFADTLTEIHTEKTYGNYTFRCNGTEAVCDTGLYVVKNTKAYTIDDAINNNVVKTDDVIKRLYPNGLDEIKPYHFTVINKAEPTTQPTTVPATQGTTVPATKPAVKNPKINLTKLTLNAGAARQLTVTNGKVKSWTTSNKKVAVVKNGKVTALNKGTAIINATLTNNKKLSCKVTVKTCPRLSKYSVVIKKGKTATVKIYGKATGVNNKYTNTKTARVVSKVNATSIKIKALKKGTTTVKILINGVKTLNVKVKVK